jgi:hypothetical protein
MTPGQSATMDSGQGIRAYIIFSGTGPILVLSTYSSLTEEGLVNKLQQKGIRRFIAYEVDIEAVQSRYEHVFESIARDLAESSDLRVLDFDGHQIMANFSVEELGEPIKVAG